MRPLALLAVGLFAGHGATQDIEFPEGLEQVSVPLLQHCTGADWGLPVVEVVIEGRRELFIVDTGDSTVTIDHTLATDLGLRKIGAQRGLGAGGMIRTTVYRGEKLELGGVALWECQYTDGDLSFLGSYQGRPIRGGLGLPFLAELVCTLDYRAGRLELRKPGTFEAPENALAIELIWGAFGLACKGDLGDGKIRRFGIDSGMESVIHLHAPMMRRLDINTDPSVGRPLIGFTGYGEEIESMQLAALATLKLGGHTFRNLPAALGTKTEGLTLGVNRVDAGMLGSSMLAPFRATFDIPGGVLYLEGDRNAPRWPVTCGIGMELRDEAVWLWPIIDNLNVCEPALEKDDQLLAIDGAPPPATTHEVFDLLGQKLERQLTIRRDGEDLVLRYRRPWPLPAVGPGAPDAERR